MGAKKKKATKRPGRKQGRPRFGKARRDALLSIRMEAREKKELEAKADKAGLSLTDWAREQLGLGD